MICHSDKQTPDLSSGVFFAFKYVFPSVVLPIVVNDVTLSKPNRHSWFQWLFLDSYPMFSAINGHANFHMLVLQVMLDSHPSTLPRRSLAMSQMVLNNSCFCSFLLMIYDIIGFINQCLIDMRNLFFHCKKHFRYI